MSNEQPKYFLVREEVQDLFRLGKEMKKKDDMDTPAMHTSLFLLTKPQPHLRVKQLKWWCNQLRHYKMEIPEWLADAEMEMILEGLE